MGQAKTIDCSTPQTQFSRAIAWCLWVHKGGLKEHTLSFTGRQVTLTTQCPLTQCTSEPSLRWGESSRKHRPVLSDFHSPHQHDASLPPSTLLPHQPVLLEATDSVWDTRRWGSGASRPGMRLSTATSGFPFQTREIPEQRRSQRLVCKRQSKQELRRQLSESFSDPLLLPA